MATRRLDNDPANLIGTIIVLRDYAHAKHDYERWCASDPKYRGRNPLPDGGMHQLVMEIEAEIALAPLDGG